MKINIEPRSLNRFKQSKDGYITIWKDENENFDFMADVLNSIQSTLNEGDIHNLEDVGNCECVPFYDAQNDLVCYLYYPDIIDYSDGKEITLFAFVPNEYERTLINLWMMDEMSEDGIDS